MDEIFSVIVAHIPLAKLLTHLNIDVHPPVFCLLLKGWMALGFHGETGLRFLSVTVGVLTCFYIYRFGAMLYNRQAGLTAAVILAFSAYHVRYSQELRDYELLSFLSLLSFYFFEKITQNSNFKNYLKYFVCSTILLYTHTFGFLTIFAQNVFFAVSFIFFHRNWARPSLRAWLTVQFAILICVLPWILTMAYQSQFLKNDSWLAAPKITSLLTVCKYYAGSWPLLLLAAAILVASAYLNSKQNTAAPLLDSNCASSGLSQKHTLLIIWFLIGISIPFVASFIRSPVFLARRMIFTSIPFYLLVSWAFSILPSKKIKSVFVILFLIFSFFSLYDFYHRPFKEQWRAAAEFIDQKAQPQDLLLFHTAFPQLGFDFYSKRPELERRGFPEPENSEVIEHGDASEIKINQVEAMTNGTGRIYQIISLEGDTSLTAKKINLLNTLLKNRKHVWLILSFSKDPQNVIFATMSKQFQVVAQKKFRGIDIYLFERKTSSFP